MKRFEIIIKYYIKKYKIEYANYLLQFFKLKKFKSILKSFKPEEAKKYLFCKLLFLLVLCFFKTFSMDPENFHFDLNFFKEGDFKHENKHKNLDCLPENQQFNREYDEKSGEKYNIKFQKQYPKTPDSPRTLKERVFKLEKDLTCNVKANKNQDKKIAKNLDNFSQQINNIAGNFSDKKFDIQDKKKIAKTLINGINASRFVDEDEYENYIVLQGQTGRNNNIKLKKEDIDKILKETKIKKLELDSISFDQIDVGVLQNSDILELIIKSCSKKEINAQNIDNCKFYEKENYKQERSSQGLCNKENYELEILDQESYEQEKEFNFFCSLYTKNLRVLVIDQQISDCFLSQLPDSVVLLDVSRAASLNGSFLRMLKKESKLEDIKLGSGIKIENLQYISKMVEHLCMGRSKVKDWDSLVFAKNIKGLRVNKNFSDKDFCLIPQGIKMLDLSFCTDTIFSNVKGENFANLPNSIKYLVFNDPESIKEENFPRIRKNIIVVIKKELGLPKDKNLAFIKGYFGKKDENNKFRKKLLKIKCLLQEYNVKLFNRNMAEYNI